MTSLTYKFATDSDVRGFIEEANLLLGPSGVISISDDKLAQISHPGIEVTEHTEMWDKVAGKHGGSRSIGLG